MNMKLSSKLAMLGGFLAGTGAVALALLKHKQREEIYHEAEIKAMDELLQLGQSLKQGLQGFFRCGIPE